MTLQRPWLLKSTFQANSVATEAALLQLWSLLSGPSQRVAGTAVSPVFKVLLSRPGLFDLPRAQLLQPHKSPQLQPELVQKVLRQTQFRSDFSPGSREEGLFG